ncbi:EamA family transporter [Candidatus Woesearchaeota archaeon]|nr:EamA family transporter [Candidatus Woesearchaeota archaeon]
MYIPIIGSIALASGNIFEKFALKKRKIDIFLYQTASFLFILLSMLPFIFFFWKIDKNAFLLKNIFIFILVILCAFFANLFIFKALKSEKLTTLQPIRSFEPIFTVLLAVLFSTFSKDFSFSLKILIPSLIASFAVIFPHIEKEKIVLDKYLIFAFFGSFFFALELVLSKLILQFYSPLTFYFLRCLFIFIFSLLIFRPDFKKLDKKTNLILLFTGIAWVTYRIALYISYDKYGVIFTTTILLLAPILTYILANTFLKEKLNWKNILSSLIIILCVVYLILFK